MFRKIYRWVILVVLVAAAAGGYVYYRQVFAAPDETEETPLQTATVRMGSLVISATGTGTVTAKSELSVGFEKSGVVTELLVAVGDEVQLESKLGLSE